MAKRISNPREISDLVSGVFCELSCPHAKEKDGRIYCEKHKKYNQKGGFCWEYTPHRKEEK